MIILRNSTIPRGLLSKVSLSFFLSILQLGSAAQLDPPWVHLINSQSWTFRYSQGPCVFSISIGSCQHKVTLRTIFMIFTAQGLKSASLQPFPPGEISWSSCCLFILPFTISPYSDELKFCKDGLTKFWSLAAQFTFTKPCFILILIGSPALTDEAVRVEYVMICIELKLIFITSSGCCNSTSIRSMLSMQLLDFQESVFL